MRSRSTSPSASKSNLRAALGNVALARMKSSILVYTNHFSADVARRPLWGGILAARFPAPAGRNGPIW